MQRDHSCLECCSNQLQLAGSSCISRAWHAQQIERSVRYATVLCLGTAAAATAAYQRAAASTAASTVAAHPSNTAPTTAAAAAATSRQALMASQGQQCPALLGRLVSSGWHYSRCLERQQTCTHGIALVAALVACYDTLRCLQQQQPCSHATGSVAPCISSLIQRHAASCIRSPQRHA